MCVCVCVCGHGTKISVFGTDTRENPRFLVPISVPKQNKKKDTIQYHSLYLFKIVFFCK